MMRFSLFIYVCFCSTILLGQSKTEYAHQLKMYEPNEVYPFGQLNPAAPPETAQFDFMIGICDCIDSIRNNDGTWLSFPTIWQGKYFLNGYGIQDNYFNPKNPTSNIRLFDSNSKTWKVTYFQQANSYFAGTWEGKKQGDRIILNREQTNANGDTVISQLTFYNINDLGFDWKSETKSNDGKTVAGWIQHCKKRE